jgi:hypothetical protein
MQNNLVGVKCVPFLGAFEFFLKGTLSIFMTLSFRLEKLGFNWINFY